jgi:hypothetical protein
MTFILTDLPDEDAPVAMSGTLVTVLDLYRIGDASGPALDRLRRGIDISVIPVNGVDWVEGTPNGGASMRSSTYPLKRSRWWRLPTGSPYSSQLAIRNDHGTHWLIEPSADMPLDAYENLLRALNGLFV